MRGLVFLRPWGPPQCSSPFPTWLSPSSPHMCHLPLGLLSLISQATPHQGLTATTCTPAWPSSHAHAKILHAQSTCLTPLGLAMGPFSYSTAPASAMGHLGTGQPLGTGPFLSGWGGPSCCHGRAACVGSQLGLQSQMFWPTGMEPS